MADHLNFADVQKKLVQARREILTILPNQAQNYFVKSFTDQGIGGKPWKEVQRRIPGDKAYKYPKTKGLQRRTSPILIGAGWKKRGGTLRRAVSTMARTTATSENGFRMIVDVPYASYLNDGTDNMVARSFIKQTPELTEMQTEKINQIISKIFK